MSFNITAVDRTDASHDLKGTVTQVKNKGEITLTVNGQPDNSFQFVPATGVISAKFKLQPGTFTFVVTAKNECGQDSKTSSVTVAAPPAEEKPCGPRINPGNSAWQFCMITPSGTYNRDNLTNKNFSYSGPASSLYFMTIAGGGNAVVNGKPYSVRPGQYYLFTGKLKVTVSNRNPGSMGHWSVCIDTDKEPVFGSGNNRPKSPCEPAQEESKPGNQEEKGQGNQDEKGQGNQDEKGQGKAGDTGKGGQGKE